MDRDKWRGIRYHGVPQGTSWRRGSAAEISGTRCNRVFRGRWPQLRGD